MTDQWKHDDLARDLALHLIHRTGRRAFLDMQLGPAGSPRPDVFTICHSYQSPEPISYECKVTRSDLMRDTASGKWAKYLKFSTGVVFAIPKGLATKDEIPRAAGLIVRSENVWRMARRPIFSPVQIPQFALFKIAFDSRRAEVGREPSPRSATAWLVAEKLRAELGSEIAEILKDTVAARDRIEDLKTYAKKLSEKAESDRVAHQKFLWRQQEAEKVNISADREALARLRGLDPGARIHELSAALAALRDRIDGTAEVRHLRAVLEDIGRALEKGRPIPHTKEDEDWKLTVTKIKHAEQEE